MDKIKEGWGFKTLSFPLIRLINWTKVCIDLLIDGGIYFALDFKVARSDPIQLMERIQLYVFYRFNKTFKIGMQSLWKEKNQVIYLLGCCEVIFQTFLESMW